MNFPCIVTGLIIVFNNCIRKLDFPQGLTAFSSSERFTVLVDEISVTEADRYNRPLMVALRLSACRETKKY